MPDVADKSTASSAPPTDTSSSRVAELDGFRAIAVLMVFAHHLFYGWPTPALSSTPRVIRAVLGRGWLGVDLFFVLSGFLITGILIDSREGEHYFRNFYTRRILRIVPLYLTCILIMYFGYPRAGAYFRLSLLYLANFSYFFGVKVPHGPGVFWSLAIEEHFYLLWPLVVRFLNRFWLLLLTAVIVFGTPILRGVCAHAGMSPEFEIYPYSFFRFDGLALGAMLAIVGAIPLLLSVIGLAAGGFLDWINLPDLSSRAALWHHRGKNCRWYGVPLHAGGIRLRRLYGARFGVSWKRLYCCSAFSCAGNHGRPELLHLPDPSNGWRFLLPVASCHAFRRRGSSGCCRCIGYSNPCRRNGNFWACGVVQEILGESLPSLEALLLVCPVRRFSLKERLSIAQRDDVRVSLSLRTAFVLGVTHVKFTFPRLRDGTPRPREPVCRFRSTSLTSP